MDSIWIRGKRPLYGEMTVQGSKNAVLPILASTILIAGKTTLRNCPDISDVDCMCRILQKIGATVTKTGHEICVDASGALQSRLPAEEVVRMRSSIVLTGALLGRLGQASFCDPGGCVIGDRPIDLHLKAFAQRKIGFNTMLISQDEIRRNMLWVKDGIDTKALPLMIELLKYGNEHSDIVILEGIMYDEWYNPLFNVANELYGANVYSYYFNIPFEETVRRHQTRSKSQEFGEEHMRQWWREKDFSSVLEEEIISCEMDAECIIEKIYTDLLKYI